MRIISHGIGSVNSWFAIEENNSVWIFDNTGISIILKNSLPEEKAVWTMKYGTVTTPNTDLSDRKFVDLVRTLKVQHGNKNK